MSDDFSNPEDAHSTITPEQAWRDSEDLEFLGKPIANFSFVRQTAAIELGLKYWRLNAEDLYTLKLASPEPGAPDQEIPMYNGFIMDIAIVLWLCHQTETDVRRARRKPADYEARIDAWADANDITLRGGNFNEARDLFFQIVQAVNASKAEPNLDLPAEKKTAI